MPMILEQREQNWALLLTICKPTATEHAQLQQQQQQQQQELLYDGEER